MERKPDIQYVHQFYIYGSEAPAIELEQSQKKKRFSLPRVVPDRKLRLRIDPMAVCGIAVAVVMVILMAVGVSQYMAVCDRYEAMSNYVIDLRNENVSLQRQYRAGYELDDIYDKAIAIGMIPREDAEVITIADYVPIEQDKPSLWDDIIWFCKGLFA